MRDILIYRRIMKYIARGNLLVVENLSADQPAKKVGGIYLPEGVNTSKFLKLKVLSVGKEISDINVGDIVLAENAFNAFDDTDGKIGIISSNFVSAILK